MKYEVPVTFMVESSDSNEAAEAIRRVLTVAGLLPIMTNEISIGQGISLASCDIEISDKLKKYLDDEIMGNDNDANGGETDLFYCYDKFDNDPLDEAYPGHDLHVEMDALMAKAGGACKACLFLPHY